MQLFLDIGKVFVNLLQMADRLHRSYVRSSKARVISIIVSPWIRPTRIAVNDEVLELDEYFAYLAPRCHIAYICSRDPEREQRLELEHKRTFISRIQNIKSKLNSLVSTLSSKYFMNILNEIQDVFYRLKRGLDRSERRYREETRFHNIVRSIPNVVLRYNQNLHAKLYAVPAIKIHLVRS